MIFRAIEASLRRKFRRRVNEAIGPLFEQIGGRVAHLEALLAHVDAQLADAKLRASVQEAKTRNPLLVHGLKVYSQNDEDGLIEAIWHRIAGDRTGVFLELGVGDGTENNSLNLLVKGWRGAWLGAEPVRVPTDGGALVFRKCWIDKDNVAELAREALQSFVGAPLDIASVDLDGNDFHVNEALLESGLRPSIWIAEYNARFSPHTHWVMPYDKEHQWDATDYYGVSLASLVELFARYDYRPVACNVNGVNVFFVANRHAAAFADVPADVDSLYMPANFHTFPSAGHRMSLKVVEAALRGASRVETKAR